LAATALNAEPGELLDRLHHGDPQAMFAVAAAQEQHTRERDRWESLFEMIKKHAEATTP